MHGAEVWPAFLAGNIARIRGYCETDVLNTYLIYLRFQLLRGRLNSAEHAHELPRCARCCSSRVQSTCRNLRHRGPRRSTAGYFRGRTSPIWRTTAGASRVWTAKRCSSMARCRESGCGCAFSNGGGTWTRRDWSRSSRRPRRAWNLNAGTLAVCGGCTLQHYAATAQLESKQNQLLENLQRIGQVRPLEVLTPLPGPAYGYRRRARLGVKYVHKKGRVLAGFREREKPYLADIKRCEVLLEPLARLPEEIAALTETLSIREAVRQVEVAAGDASTALVFSGHGASQRGRP